MKSIYSRLFFPVLFCLSMGTAASGVEETAEPEITDASLLGSDLEFAMPPSPRELFEQAAELSTDDREEAIALYHEGLIQKPEAIEARRTLATLYEAEERYLDAASQYERILREESSAELYLALARAYAAGGAPMEAALTAEDGVEKHPRNLLLLRKAGIFFTQAGRYSQALTWLEQADAADSDDNDYWLSLLIAALETGAWSQASLALTHILNQNDVAGAVEVVESLYWQRPAVDGAIIFPPRGWYPSPEGFEDAESGNFLSVASALDKEEAEQMIADYFPEMAAGTSSADDAEMQVKGFRLRREEIASPPGILITLEPEEDSVEQLYRLEAWLGEVAGRWLVVRGISAAGMESIDFSDLCAEVVANMVLIPRSILK